MTRSDFKVGIVGAGWIAEKAAITLNGLEGFRPYAIGSRSLEKAQAFADKWGIERAYGSYTEVIEDPEVDLLYVATPHSHHFEVTKEALEKAVETAKPVVNEAISETMDFIKEVKEDTRPE